MWVISTVPHPRKLINHVAKLSSYHWIGLEQGQRATWPHAKRFHYKIWQVISYNNITSTSVFGDGRISTHADPTHGQRAGRIGHRTGHARVARGWPAVQGGPAGQRAYRFVRFWAFWEHSSPKCEILCPGRRWTTVQNLTPLALSYRRRNPQPYKITHTQITNKYVRLRDRRLSTHADSTSACRAISRTAHL